MSEPHPEDFCDDCGRPNMAWWVDSERWNATYRANGRNPIVCPQCFVTAYAKVHGHHNDGLWELRLDERSTLARAEACPTCSGPIRETVGMVCQTCGTDYGRQP